MPKLLESLRNPEFHPDDQFYLEFKLISSYLLFFATSSPSPISSQFISQLSDIISKAGSAENIAFWCNWTPQQMSLMSSENLFHGRSFHRKSIHFHSNFVSIYITISLRISVLLFVCPTITNQLVQSKTS